MSALEPRFGPPKPQEHDSMACRRPPSPPDAPEGPFDSSPAPPQSSLQASAGRSGRSSSRSSSTTGRPGEADTPGPAEVDAGTSAQATASPQPAASMAVRQQQAQPQALRTAPPLQSSSSQQECACSPPDSPGSGSGGSGATGGDSPSTGGQQQAWRPAAPSAVRTAQPCCTGDAPQRRPGGSPQEGAGSGTSSSGGMGALSPGTAVRRKAAFFDALVHGTPPPAMSPMEAMAPALAGRLALDAAAAAAAPATLPAARPALPEVELVANPQHSRQEGCMPVEPAYLDAQQARRSLAVSFSAESPASLPDPRPAAPQQHRAWAQQPLLPGAPQGQQQWPAVAPALKQAESAAEQQRRQQAHSLSQQQQRQEQHLQGAAVSQRPPVVAQPVIHAAQHEQLESGAENHESAIELQEQGHEEAMLNTIARLEREQQDRDVELAGLRGALQRKSQECGNLMGVVRELTTSRSKLVSAKTTLAEQLAELWHEQMRLARIADLSRTVSKENVAKAARAQRSLCAVEDECAQQKQLTNYLQQRNAVLKGDNQDLRRRIMLLERLDVMRYAADSVCMREFQLYALKESY